ncbi:SDR family NAD(P)-dependent oxidoreductase, partial [Kitasatospora putterlickiae]|uniref:SDR family NAD(P)-dependent oxidoreductase n=1 Tax=Kitasatospora putterlickiae TaxID=221725 RepID=UPI0031D90B50
DHGLLAAAVDIASGDSAILSGTLSLATHPWLADHAVTGTALLPGTAFLDLALHAADHTTSAGVKELLVQTPLLLPTTGALDLQIVIDAPDPDGCRNTTIYSRPHTTTHTTWTRHAQATLAPHDGSPATGDAAFAAPGAWPPADATPVPTEDLYETLAGRGYAYGPAFQGLTRLWRGADPSELFAEVVLPEAAAGDADRFGLHPALLDAALHGLSRHETFPQEGVWLPFSWNGIGLHASGARTLRVRLRTIGEAALQVTAADPSGQLVLNIDELHIRAVDPGRLATAAPAPDGLFSLDWIPVPAPAAEEADLAGVALLGQDPLGLGAALTGATAHGDVAALAAALDGGAPAPACAVVTAVSPAEEQGLPESAHRIAADLLAVVQAWIAEPRLESTPLLVLTRGAVAAGQGPRADVTDLPASTAWGLIRSAQSEHPDRFVLLDTDPDTTEAPDHTALITRALGTGEPQLAHRSGTLLALRVGRGSGTGQIPAVSGFGAGHDWRIDALGGGTFDEVGRAANPRATRPLEPGEIRLQVRAAGLNFYDVAVALGMVTVTDGLGAEGAGVVVETGPGVTRFAVGDRVLGTFPSAFAPLTVADERMVAPVPEGWSFEQAASIPAVFLTAYYALHDLANLQPGERVLIHAATGGVGMAAVQLARHLGAEVYATASPAKWDTLRAMGLDDDHIANSRTLDFADHFRTTTHGHGLDVILASLAGEPVDTSLTLLAPGGRYLEMGKTDIRRPEDTATAHPGTTYQAFDLKEAGPDRTHAMLTDLLTLFNDNTLTPPPRTTWHLADLRHALRHMSQGRHTGKNVITIPTPVNPHGTVLITGGTGTLGSLLARHLVTHHHTTHLHLISRQGPHAPGADQLHDDLLNLGAHTVTITACDATNPTALTHLIHTIPTEHPLTAVIHTTGALDDATVASLTPDQLRAVLTTKADSAVHLHRLTAGHDLGAFVLYSSAAGLIGSAGQANYAAANTFLDALAAHRHANGLPATSLAWGLWAQASAMTGHLTDQDHARMSRSAFLPMSSEQGLRLFDAADRTARPLHLLSPLDLAHAPRLPLWSRLATIRPTAAAEQSGPALTEQLAALTPTERHQHVLGLVRRQVAVILGIDNPTVIDATRGFLDQGLDSLTAVELRNRLHTTTAIRLPATAVFDHPTPNALTQYLLDQLAPAGEKSPEEVTQAAIGRILSELDRLSALVGSVPAADIAATRVPARLSALLSTITATDPATEEADLDSVSAEELFAFIDNEL